MIVKREAGWAFCRPLTSDQTIEMAKDKNENSERVVIQSMDQLIEFKDKLLAEGSIKTNSLAALLEKGEINERKRRRQASRNSKG